MGKKTVAMWSELLDHYKVYRLHDFEVEAERATYLHMLKKDEPWKESRRYVTLAAHSVNKDRSWHSIVIHDLKESFTEVENTIFVFTFFGKDRMLKWGKDILLQIKNRVSDTATTDTYRRSAW
jgi:hypothetical protein